MVPAAECPAAQPALAELNAKVAPLVEQYLAALERIKLKEGIRLAMLVSAAGNKFFQARAYLSWSLVVVPLHCVLRHLTILLLCPI